MKQNMIFHLIHIDESISLKTFIFIFTVFFYTNCGPVVKYESNNNGDFQNTRPELVNDSSQISKTLIANTDYKPRRCDGNLVLDIEEDIENLSDTMIYLFLYTFDSICLNNIEFREHSNEVLFKMLERYPELFAIQFDKTGINQSVILNEPL